MTRKKNTPAYIILLKQIRHFIIHNFHKYGKPILAVIISIAVIAGMIFIPLLSLIR